MSHIINERFLEDAAIDFDGFLEKGDWKNCGAIIDNLGDMGFTNEALYLFQKMNRAKGEAHRDLVADFAEKRSAAILSTKIPESYWKEADEAEQEAVEEFEKTGKYQNNEIY